MRSVNKTVANAVAARNKALGVNAKFKIGDKVRILRQVPNAPRKDEIGKVEDFDGDEYLVKAGQFQRWYAPKYLTAANAAADPRVKKAYEEYVKAKAKFDKWWNPDRKFSEGNNPTTRKYQDAQRAFSRIFRDVYGKLTPNGWGDMTLEQMVAKVQNAEVVRNDAPPRVGLYEKGLDDINVIIKKSIDRLDKITRDAPDKFTSKWAIKAVSHLTKAEYEVNKARW